MADTTRKAAILKSLDADGTPLGRVHFNEFGILDQRVFAKFDDAKLNPSTRDVQTFFMTLEFSETTTFEDSVQKATNVIDPDFTGESFSFSPYFKEIIEKTRKTTLSSTEVRFQIVQFVSTGSIAINDPRDDAGLAPSFRQALADLKSAQSTARDFYASWGDGFVSECFIGGAFIYSGIINQHTEDSTFIFKNTLDQQVGGGAGGVFTFSASSLDELLSTLRNLQETFTVTLSARAVGFGGTVTAYTPGDSDQPDKTTAVSVTGEIPEKEKVLSARGIINFVKAVIDQANARMEKAIPQEVLGYRSRAYAKIFADSGVVFFENAEIRNWLAGLREVLPRFLDYQRKVAFYKANAEFGTLSTPRGEVKPTDPSWPRLIKSTEENLRTIIEEVLGALRLEDEGRNPATARGQPSLSPWLPIGKDEMAKRLDDIVRDATVRLGIMSSINIRVTGFTRTTSYDAGPEQLVSRDADDAFIGMRVDFESRLEGTVVWPPFRIRVEARPVSYMGFDGKTHDWVDPGPTNSRDVTNVPGYWDVEPAALRLSVDPFPNQRFPVLAIYFVRTNDGRTWKGSSENHVWAGHMSWKGRHACPSVAQFWLAIKADLEDQPAGQ